MLWAVFAILCLAAIAVLVMPLLGQKADAARRIDYDVVVYRSQLAEIDEEIEEGLLTAEQADAARAEVHRRMLASEDAERKTPLRLARGGRYARIGAAAAIALVVPIGAAVLYGALGSPGLPGEPYAWRLHNDSGLLAAATADKLALLLQADPSAVGYEKLGRLYFDARDYDKAAAADRRAIELGAGDAVVWSEFGEALVMTNGGAVVPEAMMAFTHAVTIEPRSERSRFYLGLAEAQIGKLRQAVAIWRDLERTSAADAPWLPMLREHIAAFARQGGFDPASVPPGPPDVAAMNAALAAMMKAMHANAGVTADAAPPPAPASDSQDVMIRAMVQRLADRLQETPSDVEGWRRLARAYEVLGDREKARDAADHAVRLKPDDVGVQMTLAEVQKAAAPAGDEVPRDFVATMRKVLALDANNVEALYYVGLAEFKAGRAARARGLWNKALTLAATDDPLAADIRSRLGNAKPD